MRAVGQLSTFSYTHNISFLCRQHFWGYVINKCNPTHAVCMYPPNSGTPSCQKPLDSNTEGPFMTTKIY